jgi:serine O-acetyltransferase
MAHDRLIELVQDLRSRDCPVAQLHPLSHELLDRAMALLFPHFALGAGRDRASVSHEVESFERLLDRIGSILSEAGLTTLRPPTELIEGMPEIRAWLAEDADAFNQRDPAARGLDEVVLAYPGFYGIATYRIAHALYELGVPLVPRLLTERAHQTTGVDIHPGASIGLRFVIDHGTGVVVGETSIIGNEVTIYQGVTLGALAVEKALAAQKRHPTIEDQVLIYANATILGGQTVIGRESIIGGNAWVTQSVPPRSKISQLRRRTDPPPPDPSDPHI